MALRDSASELRSLLFIGPGSGKRYLSGGQVRGCYFGIGKPNGLLRIVEGYATGASVHAATGHAVAVASNADNLEPVARWPAKFPDLRLILALTMMPATKEFLDDESAGGGAGRGGPVAISATSGRIHRTARPTSMSCGASRHGRSSTRHSRRKGAGHTQTYSGIAERYCGPGLAGAAAVDCRRGVKARYPPAGLPKRHPRSRRRGRRFLAQCPAATSRPVPHCRRCRSRASAGERAPRGSARKARRACTSWRSLTAASARRAATATFCSPIRERERDASGGPANRACEYAARFARGEERQAGIKARIRDEAAQGRRRRDEAERELAAVETERPQPLRCAERDARRRHARSVGMVAGARLAGGGRHVERGRHRIRRARHGARFRHAGTCRC